jgi:ribosomal protein S18 acetylase RimI-like enzyme
MLGHSQMPREIRLAGPQDVETVAALLAAFRDWWGSATPSDETFRRTVAVLLDDPRTEFLLAGEDGLAQLRYRLSAWTGTEDCWLEDLYVRDTARGSGLGRAMTEACIERARSRGCRRIELDVNQTNAAAIGLYTSLGFAVEPKPPGRTLFLGRKL